MPHHVALGLDICDLDVVIVDDFKPMQAIFRNIFSGIRNARTRVMGDVDTALTAMMSEPPNMVLMEWNMQPRSGLELLRELRQSGMEPLCLVPILVISAGATRPAVETAFRLGAQSFLLKPVSPESIVTRLRWLCRDRRHLTLKNEHYVIEGVEDRLTALASGLKPSSSKSRRPSRRTPLPLQPWDIAQASAALSKPLKPVTPPELRNQRGGFARPNLTKGRRT